MGSRGRLLCLVGVFVWLVPLATWSQPAPGAEDTASTASQIEELASEAQAHYRAGEFGEAVSDYLKAYKLGPAAALIYNIAIIYDRKLNEIDLAMEFYRRYIRAEDADPEAVLRATARLGELKELKKKREAPPPPPRVAVTPGAGNQPGGSAGPPPGTAGGVSSKVERQEDLSTWGWIALGTGAGFVTLGTVLGLQALGTQSDLDSAKSDAGDLVTARARDQMQTMADDGNSQALMADVFMGVGLAAAGAGAYLLFLHGDAGTAATASATDRADSRFYFGGSPLPSGGGVWVGGRL